MQFPWWGGLCELQLAENSIKMKKLKNKIIIIIVTIKDESSQMHCRGLTRLRNGIVAFFT